MSEENRKWPSIAPVSLHGGCQSSLATGMNSANHKKLRMSGRAAHTILAAVPNQKNFTKSRARRVRLSNIPARKCTLCAEGLSWPGRL